MADEELLQTHSGYMSPYFPAEAEGGMEDHSTHQEYTPTLDQTPYKGSSIRMKGIVDEISAFQRTFRNAKKASGQ